MKSHLAPALTCSAMLHVSCLAMLWWMLSIWRPTEVAINRGGIVLRAVTALAPSEESHQHWHVHAPFVKSDHHHDHETGEVVLHRHEPMPEVEPRQRDAESSAANQLELTKVEPPRQPAAMVTPPEVKLPPPAQKETEPAPRESESTSTATASAIPRAAKQPAELPEASVAVEASPAAQQNVAGAKVDVLPQSLPINAPPDYPASARAQRQVGVVMLSVEVNAAGRVAALKVITSSGYPLLDQAAIVAVRKWQFKPALRAGLAVSTTVQVPIRFAIRD